MLNASTFKGTIIIRYIANSINSSRTFIQSFPYVLWQTNQMSHLKYVHFNHIPIRPHYTVSLKSTLKGISLHTCWESGNYDQLKKHKNKTMVCYQKNPLCISRCEMRSIQTQKNYRSLNYEGQKAHECVHFYTCTLTATVYWLCGPYYCCCVAEKTETQRG